MVRSRFERGSGSGSWIGARAAPGALALVATLGLLFLALVVMPESLRGWVGQHLALIPRRGIGREPWQIATAGFFHFSLSALVGSLISIWVFGTAIEQRIGRQRMWLLFGAAQLAGMLTMGLAGLVLGPEGTREPLVSPGVLVGFSGALAGAAGLIGAFGVHYGPVPLRLFGAIEMRGRTLALFVLGVSVVSGLVHHDWVLAIGEIVGALCGWTIATGRGLDLATAWHRLHLWRLRRRYKVIPGGRDSKRYLN